MKNLVFAFALLCSTSLVAQFFPNQNSSGIQSISNNASGDRSTAMGNVTEASGYVSTAMGVSTTASGDFATAMGLRTKAQDFAATAIGTYNIDETPNPTGFSLQNSAFVIGNGGYDSQGNWLGGADETRSNAFEVLFDGTTTIAGDLNINSDARLKANIISLGATPI